MGRTDRFRREPASAVKCHAPMPTLSSSRLGANVASGAPETRSRTRVFPTCGAGLVACGRTCGSGSRLGADLELLEGDLAVDRGLLGQAEHPLADDVALHL